jgi:hypothetical protein
MLMLWANGSKPGTVRCFSTPSYARLWDYTVVDLIRTLTQDESNGWHIKIETTHEQEPAKD